MRQIPICAVLLMAASLAACGGEKFTSAAASESAAEPDDRGMDGKGASGAAMAENAGGTGPALAGSGANAGAPITETGGASSFAGSLSTSGGHSMAGTAGAAEAGGGGVGGGITEECPEGLIKFRMLPHPDLPAGYLCDAGCGTGWLTITDAEGAVAYSLFSACGSASCDSCEMLACSASACLPTPVTDEGVTLEWTGTYMTKDTCGANVACQRPTCVKPGRYKARACASLNGGASQNSAACAPLEQQLCAVAEFDFPANDTVKLVLTKQ